MNIIKKNNNINKDEKAKSLYKDIYGNEKGIKELNLSNFNYKDKMVKRDVKIFYTDGSIDNIVHVVESKGYFTYTTHSKEIEKIEVYENDKLLYDEYNKNIYSYVEFTIF